MNKDRIKEAYNAMTPDEAARQRMLKRIMNRGGHSMKKEYTSQPHNSRGWLGTAAAILVLVVLMAGVVTMLRRESPDHLSSDSTGNTTESTNADLAETLEEFKSTAFYRAAMEYYDWTLAFSGAAPDQSVRMAEIAEDYGLELYDGDDRGTDDYSFFLETVMMVSFLRDDVANMRWEVASCWYYDQQRFNVAGTVTFEGENPIRATPLDFNFYRTTPEYLLHACCDMGRLENYETWLYPLDSGEAAILAMSGNKGYVIVHRTEEILFVEVTNWLPLDSDPPMTREALEAVTALFCWDMTVRTELETTDIEIETVPEVSAYPYFVIDDLANCTAAVSLQPGDYWQDDAGNVFMNVTIYTCYRYAAADIAGLTVGKHIYTRTGIVEITSLEYGENGDVLINGGANASGYTLRMDGDDMYCEVDANNQNCWHEYATSTIPVSVDCQFRYITDACAEIHTVSDFLETCGDYTFLPENTTIDIQNGSMLSMEHVCSREEAVHHDDVYHDDAHHDGQNHGH